MLSESRGVVRLALHVQPGAKRNSVVGIHGDALKIAVSAPPVDGKANDAICIFIAELLRLPVRSVSVIAGATSRRKVLAISDAKLADVEATITEALSRGR
ncbi:MAG: DUF167 domain-containing protein [Gemmatimonadaceae bacterium]